MELTGKNEVADHPRSLCFVRESHRFGMVYLTDFSRSTEIPGKQHQSQTSRQQGIWIELSAGHV